MGILRMMSVADAKTVQNGQKLNFELNFGRFKTLTDEKSYKCTVRRNPGTQTMLLKLG